MSKAVPAFGDRFRKVVGDPSNVAIERREPPSTRILAQNVQQISGADGEVAGLRRRVLVQDSHELWARKGNRGNGLRNGSRLMLRFGVLLGCGVYDAGDIGVYEARVEGYLEEWSEGRNKGGD